MFSQDRPDDVLDKIVPTIIRSNRGFGRDEIVACEKEFSPRECEYLWQFPDKYIGKSKGSHYFSYQTSDLGQVLICGEAMFCANPADATRTEAMMWARRTNGESGSPTMRFDLNDSFALSLKTPRYVWSISIRAKDAGNYAMTARPTQRSRRLWCKSKIAICGRKLWSS